jgi:hypothetical protein
MNIKPFIVSLGLCAGGLCITNPADAGTWIYHFQSMDPTVHENFYCTVAGGTDTDKVEAFNHAEMITGFNEFGKLENITASDINKYYFDAYHDNEKSDPGIAWFKVLNTKAQIICQPGTGDRELIPGPYGKGR